MHTPQNALPSCHVCIFSLVEKDQHLSPFSSTFVILFMWIHVNSRDVKKQSEGKTNSGDEKQAEARKAW